MLSNNQVHILSSNIKQTSTVTTSSVSSSLKSIPINKVISSNVNLERHTYSTTSSTDPIQFQYQRSNHQQPHQQQQQQQQPANPMQIQNYVTWINSHLKKRPGVKLVENLQTDVSNGVCLIHLIEVISGTVLTDVNLNPKTPSENKDNIEKILKFMHHNAIKMHQTNSKEILEGNLKSIMRLVLALAAHYKPTNVQPYSAVIGRNNQTYSPSSNNQKNMAQTANSNKRSYSTNHINSQPISQPQTNNNNNNYVNNTYVVDSLKNQTAQTNFNQRPVLNSTRNLDSMTHLVQAACVSLADVRRFKNENFNVKYIKRNTLDSPNTNQTYSLANNINNHETNNINSNYTMANYTLSSPSAVNPIASSTVLLPNKPATSRNLTYVLNKMSEKNTMDDVDSSRKESDAKENQVMNKTKVISKIKQEKNETNEPSLSSIHKNLSSPKQENNQQQPTELLLNELQNQFDLYQCDALEDVQSLKSILLNLQTLLMNENTSDVNKLNIINEDELKSSGDEQTEFLLSNLTPEEQITIMKSKIQQMEILSADLRSELNLIKSETMQKNGIQCGLKTRLAEQDNTILELKDEQLNMHLVNQQLIKEKEDLNFKLNERILQINQLKQEICKRDDYIDTLKLEINNLLNEKEHTNFVRQQVKQVSDTLEYVQEKENVLSDLIASADRKLIKIDNQLAFNQQMNKDKINKCYQILNKEEEQNLKDSLLKLRQSLNTNGSSQHLINTLEHTFLTIINRLNLVQTNNNNSITPPSSSSSSNYNGPTSALHTSTTTPISSSTSSSLTSSSANSPVLQVVQSSHLSLSSSINSTASSSSSSSSSLSAVHITGNIGNNNNNSNNSKHSNDNNDHVELPIINNESNVKKIISRLLSQNNQAKDDCQTKQNTIRFKNLNGTSNSGSNTLLTISSNVISNTESIQSSSAKCIYYMDNKTNSPPYMITIPKNISTITLNDFKEYVKLKHGSSYIYHFKAQDPEFGIVKEEISNGHKILPSFENRIIAWIQEID